LATSRALFSCNAHRQLWACKNKAKSHIINNLLTLNGHAVFMEKSQPSAWPYWPCYISVNMARSWFEILPLRVEILEYWMVTYILHLPGEELKSWQCVLLFYANWLTDHASKFMCVIERILLIALTRILKCSIGVGKKTLSQNFLLKMYKLCWQKLMEVKNSIMTTNWKIISVSSIW